MSHCLFSQAGWRLPSSIKMAMCPEIPRTSCLISHGIPCHTRQERHAFILVVGRLRICSECPMMCLEKRILFDVLPRAPQVVRVSLLPPTLLSPHSFIFQDAWCTSGCAFHSVGLASCYTSPPLEGEKHCYPFNNRLALRLQFNVWRRRRDLGWK